MASYMEPDTNHGGYWLIETWGGTFLVPDDVLEGEPTPDNLHQYMPEGIGMTMGDRDQREEWTITHRVGWYGRLSAPGYLDCTDWEWADSEEELLESLTDGCEDEECDDDDPRVSPDTDPEADEAINLDCMSVDPNDLREWADNAPTSIPDDARDILKRYARLKADAMEQRIAGRIPQAGRIESQLETIYRSLPEKYRW